MFSTWKIAKPFGIEFNIHWTFLLLPLWVLFTFQGDFVPLWMAVLYIVPLFLCILTHEYGHALMAKQFGIETRSITLTPLGGIAQLERMSREPWEEFWIAVAGPAVNVAIATVLGIGLGTYAALDPNFMNVEWWRFFLLLFGGNIFLVLFNMIPAFPMDGGRVLRTILAGAFGTLQGTRLAVTIGTVIAILMGLAGVLWLGNPWMVLIALFVIWAGHQELPPWRWRSINRTVSTPDNCGRCSTSRSAAGIRAAARGYGTPIRSRTGAASGSTCGPGCLTRPEAPRKSSYSEASGRVRQPGHNERPFASGERARDATDPEAPPSTRSSEALVCRLRLCDRAGHRQRKAASG